MWITLMVLNSWEHRFLDLDLRPKMQDISNNKQPFVDNGAHAQEE